MYEYKGIEFQITSEVTCPVCGRLKKPHQIQQIQNERWDGETMHRGYALITKCCKCIVAKSHGFDHIRGLFTKLDKSGYDVLKSNEELEKEGYKVLNGFAIPEKPEVLRRRKIKEVVHPTPPKYVEQIVLLKK